MYLYFMYALNIVLKCFYVEVLKRFKPLRTRSIMRISLLTVLFLAFLSIFVSHDTYATHVRAGEITARRISISPARYEITFTGYYDYENGKPASDSHEYAEFYMLNANGNPLNDGQDGYVRVPRVSPFTNIGNGTTKNIYVFEYTFPGPGTYSIGVKCDNRNNNVLNIGPPPTQSLNFYVRTTLIINSALGLNRTPVLLNAPIDLAAVGQRYIHNPAAFDDDGDSLAYRLTAPVQGNNRGGPMAMEYMHPTLVDPNAVREDGGSPAEFKIDPVTGDLVWDAPSIPGFYNVAFVIEEWRAGVKIGEIVRDMQIIVVDSPNDRPEFDPVDEICIEAGKVVNKTIIAKDKNGDRLTLTSYGGVYEEDRIEPPFGTFTVPNQGALAEIAGNFSWQTSCEHVRKEPYYVLFKVEDGARPGTSANLHRKLIDMVTLPIRVYGPQPQGVKAVAVPDEAGGAFRLSWDAYQCKVPGAMVAIYRKEGCTNYEIDDCEPGIPTGLGYTEIARVGVDETFYIDNNAGEGLEKGTSYSYRIVVLFPRPGSLPTEPNRVNGGGTSLASEEVCIDIPELMPVITHVTVDETDVTDGQITVRWTRPIGLTPNPTELPAEYRLYRAEGLTGGAYTLVTTISTNLVAGALDTLFVDKNLDTEGKAYNYKIEYYYNKAGTPTLYNTTKEASSVRLSQVPGETRRITLKWDAQVPWDNTFRKHKIYREDPAAPGQFNIIASVSVEGNNSFTFTDTGKDLYAADGVKDVEMDPDQLYCYKIETEGSYNNPRIKPDLLYNMSQVLCASPMDTTRPCPPVLAIDLLDCDKIVPEEYCGKDTFANTLTWTMPEEAPGCDLNLSGFNIYYARYEGDTPTLIATVSRDALQYIHSGLTSFAGCYYITAVNRFGNESDPSNTVCKDNCPVFQLPNVITPNGDGKNDVLVPMDCPAFVKSLVFTVYNRWGAKVFETTDLTINWAGTNNSGKELDAGQYFYEVAVQFESVQKTPATKVLKGWVQILR